MFGLDFYHSNCHASMAKDTLDVSKINVQPGGKQHVMKNIWWDGRPYVMIFSNSVPKGLRVVPQERGVNTNGMDVNKIILGNHPDFKFEKSCVERYLSNRGHMVCFTKVSQ